MNDPTVGTKFDGEKVRYDLLPVYPMHEVARVLTAGAAKYEARNWENGMDWGRAYAAAQRHLNAWWAGETHDRETGTNHLANAICNLMFLLEWQHYSHGTDDRIQEKKIKDFAAWIASGMPDEQLIAWAKEAQAKRAGDAGEGAAVEGHKVDTDRTFHI